MTIQKTLLCSAMWFATVTVAPAGQRVDHHDVEFTSQGVVLKGTVFLPRNAPVIAAAVLVHGAGRESRYLGRAPAFAQRGIAALTYDKRGAGESGGVYVGPEVGTNNVSRENLELLALDAAAALRALGHERRLRGVPLGFVGGSQAGWIIPLAATENPNTRFIVLLSGAVETTHENMRFEYLTLADENFWNHHTHEEMRTLVRPPLSAVPIWGATEWRDLDPRETLSKLIIPGLWLFGGRDRNTDVDLSIERLNELRAAGHNNYSYRLFADYDHQLRGWSADVIDASVTWIHKAVTRGP